MKTKIIPFDLETAKKIQAGEIEGKIVTEDGILVKLKVNSKYSERLITISRFEGYLEVNYSNIKRFDWLNYQNLFIELPEEAPKQTGESALGKCKEGDEVWIYSNYKYGPEYVKVKVGKFSLDASSGHRRNVTFENGFTCQELISKTCWKELPEKTPEEQHPIEESELYQAGYKVGFEAGRCVAFDEKKGRAIKKETPKYDDVEEVPTGDGSIVFLRHKKHEFKPFDKVLVREQSTDEWKCDYFSHAQNDGVCTYYVCIGGEFLKCVPYEGNEHLVDTTDNPKEE